MDYRRQEFRSRLDHTLTVDRRAACLADNQGVGLVHVGHDIKFVIHALALDRLHADFLWDHDLAALAVFFLQDVFHLRSHGGDDVARIGQDRLHEFVVLWGDVLPCREGVSAGRRLLFHLGPSPANAAPGMAERIDYQHAVAGRGRFANCCRVGRWSKVLEFADVKCGRNSIDMDHAGVFRQRPVFRVDRGNSHRLTVASGLGKSRGQNQSRIRLPVSGR